MMWIWFSYFNVNLWTWLWISVFCSYIFELTFNPLDINILCWCGAFISATNRRHGQSNCHLDNYSADYLRINILLWGGFWNTQQHGVKNPEEGKITTIGEDSEKRSRKDYVESYEEGSQEPEKGQHRLSVHSLKFYENLF